MFTNKFDEPVNSSELKPERRKDPYRIKSESIYSWMDLLITTVESDGFAYYRFDAVKDLFYLNYSMPHDQARHKQVSAPKGIFQLAVTQNQIQSISCQGQKQWMEHLDQSLSPLQNVWIVPLHDSKWLIGLLIFDFLKPTNLTEKYLALIGIFKEHLAQLHQSNKEMNQLLQVKSEFTFFLDAAQRINQSPRLSDVCENLLKTSFDIEPFEIGLIVLYDPKTKMNRVAFEHNQVQTKWVDETFALAPTRGLISWVIDNQKPLSFNDFSNRQDRSPLFHQKWKMPKSIESVLILPLSHQDQKLGACVFLDSKQGTFSSKHRKTLEVIHNHAALALSHSKTVNELENQASKDGLTAVFNRRSLDSLCLQEIERCKRQNSVFSVLLMDIDHFKKFNDTHGHATGDFVLQEVAKVIGAFVRKIDVVARYGGEEFCVLLPHTDANQAIVLAGRLVQEFRQKSFLHQDHELKVTVSIGASTYGHHAVTKDLLFQKADLALYQAKKLGRNQAQLYTRTLEA